MIWYDVKIKIMKRAEIGTAFPTAFRSQYLGPTTSHMYQNHFLGGNFRIGCDSKNPGFVCFKGIYPINPNKYPLYKVYMGLIIKGTIPRVSPFSPFSHGIQGYRSWQFQGLSPDSAPFNHGVVPDLRTIISERSCADAVPTTYISILVNIL